MLISCLEHVQQATSVHFLLVDRGSHLDTSMAWTSLRHHKNGGSFIRMVSSTVFVWYQFPFHMLYSCNYDPDCMWHLLILFPLDWFHLVNGTLPTLLSGIENLIAVAVALKNF